MKFRDLDGQFKDIVIKTGDTLPVGSVVEYEGSTPPAGWSKLSDGGSVIVSSEEPTTGEEVWLQRSDNIFDKNNYELFKGYMSSANRNFVANNSGYLVYIPCIPNTDYIVTREVLENNFQVGSGNIVPVNNGQVTQVILAETSSRVTIKTGANDTYLYIYVKYDGNSSYTLEQILDSLRVEISKKIHTKNDNGYEEFYNEESIKQIQESMKYLNGYIYSFKTIYYSANTDTVNDANKFVSGLHIIDNNVTIDNRPSKVNNTLEAVLVFTGNPNGSGDNGVQIWFNGTDVIYVRQKTWGSYTGWRRISVT